MAPHADADGRIPATFRVPFVMAWAPAASQPTPVGPDSTSACLADVLGEIEKSVGITAALPATMIDLDQGTPFRHALF